MNRLTRISTATTLALGMATLVITGTMVLAPASADKGNEGRIVALPMNTAVVVASRETPQEQVWDMTYGPERSPQ